MYIFGSKGELFIYNYDKTSLVYWNKFINIQDFNLRNPIVSSYYFDQLNNMIYINYLDFPMCILLNLSNIQIIKRLYIPGIYQQKIQVQAYYNYIILFTPYQVKFYIY